MFMNVTCPTCGKKCRVPESALGKQVQCPACSNCFQCGSVCPPSLMATPTPNAIPDEKPASVKAIPSARAVQVQPDQSVHYCCPRCKKPLESPTEMAGQKVNCPDCGQRLQIPKVNVPLPSVLVVQTTSGGNSRPAVVASEIPSAPAQPPASPPPTQGLIVEVVAVPARQPPAPVRRESCLECGKDISDRQRVQTCPDCGSFFCSAMCFREHRYNAHPSRRN
jgi:DNA-directed RNA polymerase subunit RPC12/RpoP